VASVRLVGMGSAIIRWWRAGDMRALLWPLFALSALSLPATIVAATKSEGAAKAYVRSIGVSLACHCGGGNNRCGSRSGLRSLGHRELIQARW
jgi:hypothetical protein